MSEFDRKDLEHGGLPMRTVDKLQLSAYLKPLGPSCALLEMQ